MTATTAASSLTLGGLLRHLALVEDYWFSQRLSAHAPSTHFAAEDFVADPDWEFTSAQNDSPDYLRSLWQDAVDLSNKRNDEALASGGLDFLAKRPNADGTAPSLRWIFIQMVAEYARHNGHADLLREAIDGETGE